MDKVAWQNFLYFLPLSSITFLPLSILKIRVPFATASNFENQGLKWTKWHTPTAYICFKTLPKVSNVLKEQEINKTGSIGLKIKIQISINEI